ncbi:MAG: 3-methyl-2-oxobutanoate dehydrogenase subunit VorB [Planctomycetota bacterium]|nr:3-methyl-2-oxobutanoate dehydrogenase subunit VorB [Planctomycetota bacterium]
MGKRVLFAGNEAIGEAAIIAGCRCYFGYPITPQNELTAYMAMRLPQVGGVFIQSESELAAIYMVLGAAAAGARVMTSSSSPGITLKQEGISYLQGDELPAVVVNVQRGGPGLGNIAPSQSDYFQATKGGGHGDYKNIVLVPHTVQEAVELTILAFDLADKYRVVVMILADGVLGQMMEPVVFPEKVEIRQVTKDYILDGAKGREPRIIRSLFLEEGVLEKHNRKLQEKYKRIEENEVRYEEMETEDAEWLIVGCGMVARSCKNVVMERRAKGEKVGLLRPITVWPFPYAELRRLVESGVKGVLVSEMNAGQMLEDVEIGVCGRVPVRFYGRMGGGFPSPEEIDESLTALIRG